MSVGLSFSPTSAFAAWHPFTTLDSPQTNSAGLPAIDPTPVTPMITTPSPSPYLASRTIRNTAIVNVAKAAAPQSNSSIHSSVTEFNIAEFAERIGSGQIQQNDYVTVILNNPSRDTYSGLFKRCEQIGAQSCIWMEVEFTENKISEVALDICTIQSIKNPQLLDWSNITSAIQRKELWEGKPLYLFYDETAERIEVLFDKIDENTLVVTPNAAIKKTGKEKGHPLSGKTELKFMRSANSLLRVRHVQEDCNPSTKEALLAQRNVVLNACIEKTWPLIRLKQLLKMRLSKDTDVLAIHVQTGLTMQLSNIEVGGEVHKGNWCLLINAEWFNTSLKISTADAAEEEVDQAEAEVAKTVKAYNAQEHELGHRFRIGLSAWEMLLHYVALNRINHRTVMTLYTHDEKTKKYQAITGFIGREIYKDLQCCDMQGNSFTVTEQTLCGFKLLSAQEQERFRVQHKAHLQLQAKGCVIA